MASLLIRAFNLPLRVERLLGAAVGDDLDALEEPAAAHVANERMIAKAILQAPRQIRALPAHIGEQVVAANDLLHGQRRRARKRMAGVGMAVLEGAGAARRSS